MLDSVSVEVPELAVLPTFLVMLAELDSSTGLPKVTVTVTDLGPRVTWSLWEMESWKLAGPGLV